jgi:hypothetical protein
LFEFISSFHHPHGENMTPSTYYTLSAQYVSDDDDGTAYLGSIVPSFVPQAEWDPREIAVCLASSAARDLLRDTHIQRYLCSVKLKSLFETHAKHSVEFFPLQLQSLDGSIAYCGWTLVHAIYDGSILLSDSSIEERHIYESPFSAGDLVVTECLKQAIEAAGIRGVEFSLFDKDYKNPFM